MSRVKKKFQGMCPHRYKVLPAMADVLGKLAKEMRNGP